jgi:hypothetical protein
VSDGFFRRTVWRSVAENAAKSLKRDSASWPSAS